MSHKQKVWIGIDVGTKGQICALRADNNVAFLPTTTQPLLMLDWFKTIAEECNVMITVVENVHAIFGSSAKSTFSFGYNAAVVEIIPLAAGLSVAKVNPKQWQKVIGLKTTTKGKAIKKEVASICQKLYPKVSIYGARGGLLDGKSDALMLAHYAKLTYR